MNASQWPRNMRPKPPPPRGYNLDSTMDRIRLLIDASRLIDELHYGTHSLVARPVIAALDQWRTHITAQFTSNA